MLLHVIEDILRWDVYKLLLYQSPWCDAIISFFEYHLFWVTNCNVTKQNEYSLVDKLFFLVEKNMLQQRRKVWKCFCYISIINIFLWKTWFYCDRNLLFNTFDIVCSPPPIYFWHLLHFKTILNNFHNTSPVRTRGFIRECVLRIPSVS